jgi:hypothetical protein
MHENARHSSLFRAPILIPPSQAAHCLSVTQQLMFIFQVYCLTVPFQYFIDYQRNAFGMSLVESMLRTPVYYQMKP